MQRDESHSLPRFSVSGATFTFITENLLVMRTEEPLQSDRDVSAGFSAWPRHHCDNNGGALSRGAPTPTFCNEFGGAPALPAIRRPLLDGIAAESQKTSSINCTHPHNPSILVRSQPTKRFFAPFLLTRWHQPRVEPVTNGTDKSPATVRQIGRIRMTLNDFAIPFEQRLGDLPRIPANCSINEHCPGLHFQSSPDQMATWQSTPVRCL